MYIGVYDHGTLTIRQGTRQRSEEAFHTIHVDITRRHAEIVVVLPGRMEYACTAHADQYRTNGVPCYALTMQHEKPEIPHGWPAK